MSAAKRRGTGVKKTVSDAAPLDRHALYELCAQNPARDAKMLRAIHAGDPRVLGEDFSGTGAISRAWVALIPPARGARGARAVAVDHDPEPLARARGVRGVKVVNADVLDADDAADIIAVLNFSICEIHARRALVKYLKHARSRLNEGGVFIADIYDGGDAYETGRIMETVKLPGHPRGKVQYEWEQRHADPLNGRVINAMHFTVIGAGPRRRIEDAFVYDWRLWSVPELRDAMSDAGFTSTEVYPRTADAVDDEGNLYVRPIDDPLDVGESFSAYVVGRR